MNSKKVLVTGSSGFIGSHVADALEGQGYQVILFDAMPSKYKTKTQKEYIGDILNPADVNKAMKNCQYVYHFAAQSFPESSFLTPVSTLTTNIIGTTNLMEELRIAKEDGVCNPIILSCSSSEVYGIPTKDEVPITEENYIRPANPYSISKVGHDLMSQYYAKAHGLRIITTRMFSHEGSRRGSVFALSNFAKQIVEAEKGYGDGKVYHGNLGSVRTYNHIDDAIKAYWLAVERCDYGEVYNIGGNHTCTVGEALDMLISKTEVEIEKEYDESRARPTDITLQIPDSTKFREKTGWEPKKNLEDICDDLLTYWRKEIK